MHGYFSQSLSAGGWQQEHYPAGDPNGLPLTLLREADGSPVRVAVTLAEGWVLARAGVAGAGGPGAAAAARLLRRGERARRLREVTDRLYGGGSEHRLRQELLLGIGECGRCGRSAR